MFIRIVGPLITLLWVVDAVVAFRDAGGVVGVGVVAPVRTPNLYRAKLGLMNATKSPTREQFLYLYVVPVTVLRYLH